MTTVFRHLALISAVLATPAFAQTHFQDLEVLEQAVVEALGAGIGQPGGPAAPLDRRLRLLACPEEPVMEGPALNAVTVRCQPLGWRIRVPLVRAAAASPVAVRAERAEPVIRRGDQVEVVAATSSFTVSTSGVAEQDGAPGDRVRVRVERRSSPLIGEVLPDGRVMLPGFNGI